MKIHKEKTIKKIILVLLIMILGSTLIELGTNIKSLYMKNQNIMKIDEDHIELKGFVKKGKGYYLSNAEGVLRCDLNNKYVKNSYMILIPVIWSMQKLRWDMTIQWEKKKS